LYLIIFIAQGNLSLLLLLFYTIHQGKSQRLMPHEGVHMATGGERRNQNEENGVVASRRLFGHPLLKDPRAEREVSCVGRQSVPQVCKPHKEGSSVVFSAALRNTKLQTVTLTFGA
jgi:hypothetical protein